jgi:hypothetical protein
VCSEAPRFDVALLTADRDQLREGVVVGHRAGQEGACPELVDQVVEEGTYFVRLSRLEAAEQFDYRVEITLREPPAEGS